MSGSGFELTDISKQRYVPLATTTEEAGVETIIRKTQRRPTLFTGLSKNGLLKAWRLTISSGALAGTLVLIINLIVLIVVYARYEIINHAATLYTGSCSTAEEILTGVHLVINVLSSVLLASSNFSMQCLSSPTRAEVDAAHAKRHWLSIGTPNVRNLLYLSKAKAALWLLLGLSSLPLHIMWNSVFFQSLATNEYVAVSATPEFANGASWSFANGSGPATPILEPKFTPAIDRLQAMAQASNLTRLETADCIRQYGQNFQKDHKNLVLVTDYHNTSNPSSLIALYYYDFTTSDQTTFGWLCPPDTFYDGDVWACSTQYIDKNAASIAKHWVPASTFTEIGYVNYDVAGTCMSDGSNVNCGDQSGAAVQYCLSEEVPGQCKIKAVPLFLAVVVICNALKIIGFIWTLHITEKDPPLITTGDAIHSFLASPDPVTQGRCLVDKMDYQKILRSKEWRPRPPGTGDVWTGGRWRWGKAVHWFHWWAFFLPISTCVILAGAFLGPDGLGGGTTETWPLVVALGIGKPQTNYAIGWEGGNADQLLTAFLIANIPQVAASYAYMLYNNLLTTMLAMREWTSYARGSSKALRVTKPVEGSQQRSTYFLSVPLHWAIPSIVIFTILHWLISQMFFLVQVEAYDVNGNLDISSSITTQYFSPLAMLLVVSISAAGLLFLMFTAIFRHYPRGSTLAGCCSGSLSAACQSGKSGFDEDLPLQKLKWGVVDVPAGEQDVGHATFSDIAVGSLMKGRLYA